MAGHSPHQMRQMMISEFEEWLRSRTKPFQADTIAAYRDAAIALDAWMTRSGLETDFTGCDTATLNRFFSWYFDKYGQAAPTPSTVRRR